MTSEYPDIREFIDGYQQLECRDCDSIDWYNPSYCYTHDVGLCEDCAPDIDYLLDNNVTVRL